MAYHPGQPPRPSVAVNRQRAGVRVGQRTGIDVVAGVSFPWTFSSTRGDLAGLVDVWLEDDSGIVVPRRNDVVTRIGSLEYVYRAVVGPVPPSAAGKTCIVYAQVPGQAESFTFEEVHVEAASTVISAAKVGSVGLLESWITADDVVIALGKDAVPDADYSADAMSASEVLYELSGRRFRGVGQTTERPGGVVPYSWRWNNRAMLMSWWDAGGYWVWPGYDPRYMEPWCFGNREPITLRNTPVLLDDGILEVVVDGQVVDPASYYLADGHYVYRVWPGVWPWYQRMDQPDGALGTFHVTYRHGSYPPQLGLDAAAALAAQMVLAKTPGRRTTLPWGTQQLIRSGVTITRAAMKEFRQQGFGIPLVDLFLDAWKIDEPAAMWSPDLPEEGSYLGS